RPWPCCLCSCRHGAAPALHSFPTRRSSDLGEAGGQARHLLFHFDPAQATVAVEIGGVEALVEAALALGLALRALGLLPGAQLGAHDVAVVVGVDGVEVLQQPASAGAIAAAMATRAAGATLPAGLRRLLQFSAADAAIAVGVEPRDACAVAHAGEPLAVVAVLAAAMRARLGRVRAP